VSEREDKTLLAKLGGQDPDRKDPLHDLACTYLAQPDQALRIAVLTSKLSEREVVYRAEAETEVIVRTASGFAIGFIDVAVKAYIGVPLSEAERAAIVEKYRWCPNYDGMREVWTNVEVKIAHVQAGELLRQLNLYRSVARGGAMVAALRYAPTQAEKQQPSGGGVKVVRLADGFDAWRASLGGEVDPDDTF
jgi:hypothetical protein